MRSCYRRADGKCEWIDANLRDFVSEFNGQMNTDYELVDCLDLHRIAGVTPKRPEVLLRSSSESLPGMVVEKKEFCWPETFFRDHKKWHRFCDIIEQETRSHFCDTTYIVSFRNEDVERCTESVVSTEAHRISRLLLGLSAKEIPYADRSGVIPWSFRRDCSGEYPKRLMSQGSGKSFDFMCSSLDIGAVQTALQTRLEAASLKFKDYQHCLKIVLLDCFGEDHEVNIAEILKSIPLPKGVDQVWFTDDDWTWNGAVEEKIVGYRKAI